MATETERKFLVVDDSWRGAIRESINYRQGYLAGNDRASIRVRVDDRGAKINIKGATVGVSRLEYEYDVPLADGHEMLDQLCGSGLVEKTRHLVPFADHLFEVDEFLGQNAGLIVAEVELESESQSVSMPSWLGRDVSHDVRYYNARLAEHPYGDWSAEDKE